MASSAGIDQTHSTVTGVDARFEYAGRVGRPQRDRRRQKRDSKNSEAGNDGTAYHGDAHTSLLLGVMPPREPWNKVILKSIWVRRGCQDFR
jgi:hypothetical protein